MATALIGYTGFVGSTLLKKTSFSDHYNSKNIEDIRGKKYELIVCAGAPAVKWKANQQPEEDLANLKSLMDHLKAVQADEFILISTVDVYRQPVAVDEDTVIDADVTEPYGKHRYLLEQFVQSHFPVHRIIRLPGLFGEDLKKNFIYDMLHTNCLHLTHHRSVFQFYDMSRLWKDINRVREEGIQIINFATEPVSAGEIADRCFGARFDNETEKPPVQYDMQSKFADKFHSGDRYLVSKEEVFEQIRSFIAAERGRQ